MKLELVITATTAESGPVYAGLFNATQFPYDGTPEECAQWLYDRADAILHIHGLI